MKQDTTLIFTVIKLFLAFFAPFAVLIAWFETTTPIKTNISWWVIETICLSAAMVWIAVKVNNFDCLDDVKKTAIFRFWRSLEPLSKKAIVVSIVIAVLLVIII